MMLYRYEFRVLFKWDTVANAQIFSICSTQQTIALMSPRLWWQLCKSLPKPWFPTTSRYALKFGFLFLLLIPFQQYKAAFERDFIKSSPTFTQLLSKFRQWRDKLEILLDSRPKTILLENFSQYLMEIEYLKFDEIEIPGQYNLVRRISLKRLSQTHWEPSSSRTTTLNLFVSIALSQP